MTNRKYSPHSLLLLAVALVLVSGCGANPQQHLDLGQWYYQKNLVDDAILEYKEAIRLLPANPRDMSRLQLAQLSQAYFNLAIAYARKDWYELALLEAKKNFDLQPTEENFRLLNLIEQRSNLEDFDMGTAKPY